MSKITRQYHDGHVTLTYHMVTWRLRHDVVTWRPRHDTVTWFRRPNTEHRLVTSSHNMVTWHMTHTNRILGIIMWLSVTELICWWRRHFDESQACCPADLPSQYHNDNDCLQAASFSKKLNPVIVIYNILCLTPQLGRPSWNRLRRPSWNRRSSWNHWRRPLQNRSKERSSWNRSSRS